MHFFGCVEIRTGERASEKIEGGTFDFHFAFFQRMTDASDSAGFQLRIIDKTIHVSHLNCQSEFVGSFLRRIFYGEKLIARKSLIGSKCAFLIKKHTCHALGELKIMNLCHHSTIDRIVFAVNRPKIGGQNIV
ncbi:hypothetical protein D3C87_1474840 [compost metagenome]